MKNNLTSYRVRFISYYYIEYNKTACDYFDDIRKKVQSEDTNQKEKDEIAKKYSPFVKANSLMEVIINIVTAIFLLFNYIFKTINKINQHIFLYLKRNKTKNKTVNNIMNNIADNIDNDKKNVVDNHDSYSADENLSYQEIFTWTISNFDKNFLLFTINYPYLKNKWNNNQKRFLKVLIVNTIIYENVDYPATKLSDNCIYYKEF